jgi:hypothetical protein
MAALADIDTSVIEFFDELHLDSLAHRIAYINSKYGRGRMETADEYRRQEPEESIYGFREYWEDIEKNLQGVQV